MISQICNMSKYHIYCLILVCIGISFYAAMYGTVNETIPTSFRNVSGGKFKIIGKDFVESNDTFRLFGHLVNENMEISDSTIEVQIDSQMIKKLMHSQRKVNQHKYPYKEIKVQNGNCRSLFSGDENELKRVKLKQENYKRPPRPADLYIEETQHCDTFKLSRGYVTSSLTKEEDEFPIAFSILMFKDLEQFERLLRAIYRPQNYYCVHVDSKAEGAITKAVAKIANCFENVFLTSKSYDVQWGTFSVLEPELDCLKELWKHKKWKYFINLTGQEFPLKTNLQLVRILTAYDGANDMESTILRANTDRWGSAGPAPHGITPVKGSVHVAVSRKFVDYVLHNQTALDFLEWTKKVKVPDETFFSSLNHNPKLEIPGTYKGVPETDETVKPFLTRFKNWGNYPFDYPCAGKRVRLICIFGVGDLPLLESRRHLFANKFYWDYQPFALDCMEELHYNRTRDEVLGLTSFDASYYGTLAFVKNKV